MDYEEKVAKGLIFRGDTPRAQAKIDEFKREFKIKEVFDILKKAIEEDSEYAWGWHCNIATAAVDEGLEHKAANRAAARFMRCCFGVDMTKQQNYIDLMNDKVESLGSKLTSSEAIYGFTAWLTTRKEKTIMGASCDCAGIPELINLFCEINKLPEPREKWADNLIHPSE